MSAAESEWLAGADAPSRPPSRAKVGRMRKIECPDCGLILYATSAAALARVGLPACACGGAFTVPNLRDRLAVDPDGLRGELEDAGFAAARSRGASMAQAEDAARVAWNDAMRAIGRRDLIVPPPARDHRAGTSRCQWEGGYCMVYVAGRYCAEHDPAAERRAA